MADVVPGSFNRTYSLRGLNVGCHHRFQCGFADHKLQRRYAQYVPLSGDDASHVFQSNESRLGKPVPDYLLAHLSCVEITERACEAHAQAHGDALVPKPPLRPLPQPVVDLELREKIRKVKDETNMSVHGLIRMCLDAQRLPERRAAGSRRGVADLNAAAMRYVCSVHTDCHAFVTGQ